MSGVGRGHMAIACGMGDNDCMGLGSWGGLRNSHAKVQYAGGMARVGDSGICQD